MAKNAGFLLCLLLMVYAFNTRSSSEDTKYLSAIKYFKTNKFKENVTEVKILGFSKKEENTLSFFSSIFGIKQNRNKLAALKDEKEYEFKLRIKDKQKYYVINDCSLSDRIHCGWMVMGCYDSKSKSGVKLSDFTIDRYPTLIYTYDKSRAKICSDKNTGGPVAIHHN